MLSSQTLAPVGVWEGHSVEQGFVTMGTRQVRHFSSNVGRARQRTRPQWPLPLDVSDMTLQEAANKISDLRDPLTILAQMLPSPSPNLEQRFNMGPTQVEIKTFPSAQGWEWKISAEQITQIFNPNTQSKAKKKKNSIFDKGFLLRQSMGAYFEVMNMYVEILLRGGDGRVQGQRLQPYLTTTIAGEARGSFFPMGEAYGAPLQIQLPGIAPGTYVGIFPVQMGLLKQFCVVSPAGPLGVARIMHSFPYVELLENPGQSEIADYLEILKSGSKLSKLNRYFALSLQLVHFNTEGESVDSTRSRLFFGTNWGQPVSIEVPARGPFHVAVYLTNAQSDNPGIHLRISSKKNNRFWDYDFFHEAPYLRPRLDPRSSLHDKRVLAKNA